MITRKQILAEHKKKRGKIAIKTKMRLSNRDELSVAYTPGVAEVSKAIAQDKKLAYQYTNKGNLVAIITDGTAVLGLGDIGPEAAIPVMEGKAAIFKEFADIDAFPLSLATKDTEEIIKIIKSLAPNFAAINLEDIAAPRCFEIEQRLIKELDIPVFHDDQHGTAIVVLAALINASKVVKKNIKKLRIVISGAGAAGLAVSKLLHSYGIQDIVVLDSKGVLSKNRKDLDKYKQEILVANIRNVQGDLTRAILGADVFIGVSIGGLLTAQMIKTMSNKAIVFALANPIPEIMPELAKKAGALVVGTGRSDFLNQINNALVFPGLFRGMLDNRHKMVTNNIKIKVAEAIASCIKKPSQDKIIPNIFDKQVVNKIVSTIKNTKK
ncbi:MAG: NADP-dependent malic enzyme [Patescibacteria group bacterium]|jgi:malate dehydrogenase (oxaloacetate-decarboxylating)